MKKKFHEIMFVFYLPIIPYQREHGDDAIEDLVDLVGVRVLCLEAGVAGADDLVQVILDALGRLLLGNFGSEALEVTSQLFGL